MRRVLTTAAIVLGCLLLLLGSVAGVVNRQVLDVPRFAQHVDAVRVDPAVTRQLGQAITTRDFDVTLARLGSGTFAERAARSAHQVELLAWLLPLLGLVLVVLGVGLDTDRVTADRTPRRTFATLCASSARSAGTPR